MHRTGFTLWIAAVVATILAGVFVPYGVLGGGAASAGIFLFWCGFGVAVVVLIAAGVARWRV
jgi:hypothetical protein